MLTRTLFSTKKNATTTNGYWSALYITWLVFMFCVHVFYYSRTTKYITDFCSKKKALLRVFLLVNLLHGLY